MKAEKNTYIGIDLGTSSVKLLLVESSGAVLGSASRSYPVSYPQSGYSEQDPADWISGIFDALTELLTGQDSSRVRGISFGGQMHGLVVLDENNEVIRPTILWNDGRTEEETAYLNETVGKDFLSRHTANIAFAGFTAPKILWMKKNEPENFARIRKIMLPKDYAAYRISGVFATDYSDASGMLLLDVEKRRWSREMCALCGIDESLLPALHESYEPIGRILPEIAQRFGLSADVSVSIGAGDNAAAAIGTGTVHGGSCNISLGTSGTVFIAQDRFSVDEKNALHSFCHASGGYHLMGCVLSAASCNTWWMNEVLGSTDFDGEQAGLSELLGGNDVYFLPYLMGERSPHNDVSARGAFIGMRPDTGRKYLTLAVLEGVAFALRDCVEIARQSGIDILETKICGGGAKSALWREIIANVLGIPVRRLAVEEGPAYGAAILAMVGSGEYPTVDAAVDALVRDRDTVYPCEETVRKYEQRYQIFRRLYPALKESFWDM